MNKTLHAFSSRISASLSFRLGWNLLLAGGVGAAAMLFLLNATINDRFEFLEDTAIQGHIDRSGSMLESMKAQVQAKSMDWAVWDATFDFIHDGNQSYIDENLSTVSMLNLDVNAMGFVRFDGAFRRGEYVDLESEEKTPDLAAIFLAHTTTPDFIEAAKRAPNFQTFIRQGDRLLVLSAAQVTMSDGSGAPEGFLVLGKEIGEEDIFEALQIPGQVAFERIDAPSAVIKDSSGSKITRQVTGLSGAPIATIGFTVPRNLVAQGRRLFWLASSGMLIMLILMIALVSYRLWAIVIRPIESFQHHVAKIKDSGQLADFTSDPRSDELGELYTEFNEMARELDALRSKIEAQSFAIGKSESAIGTMHNVRNGLSPVRAILTKLDGEMILPMETEIGRAITELSSAAEPSARREKLLSFLQTAISHASGSMTDKKVLLREAIRSLNGAVETIETVQSADNQKQSYSETCDLSSLVGNAATLARHVAGLPIEVEFASDERFQIAGNRVLLAQILENIVTNAVESISATERGSGRIDIAASRIVVGTEACVRVDITDSGNGFDADLTSRIFERGFSTRGKTGRGLGLHWCANTVNAMGGNFTINSPGPGAGATVTLVLRTATHNAESGQTSPRAA
ncbi:CHASE4 domain-containing protein [Hyphomonas sp.]|uniref:CHASE4 domain-containing protein n=1 Tax=Hyphomonas sp. TaxID=87 RepID=UPI001DBFB031|nr:CHASE4 domain-containing protein [Hyphomonas sp.]MBU4063603.1 HAMP domain-containing protein [Alphaproteobacteria bacterium]MBU4165772.1 HAMP domain-containing protein [Alphaproteobacteria bacterium]